LVEVGVPVEEEEPVAAAAPQRHKVAEQDRAVAAEHHRELAPADDRADGIGERDGVFDKAARVKQHGLGIALGFVRRRLDATGAAGAEPFGQTRGEQRLGQRLDPFWEQAEHGRGFDDCERFLDHVLPQLRGRKRGRWSGESRCRGRERAASELGGLSALPSSGPATTRA
jgi:hypothetical protein